MNEPRNNGGPAFPAAASVRPNAHNGSEAHRLGYTVTSDGGMSLRDWFAGQALAGYVATEKKRVLSPEVGARIAYAYADAMLAERAK